MPPQRPVVSKKFVWSAEATEWLLEMWQENLQDFRCKRRKNLDIMKKMAAAMREYDITWVEIKAKMDNMKKRYRNEFQKIKSSGSGRSKWNYFSKMRLLVDYSDDEDDDDLYDIEAERMSRRAYQRRRKAYRRPVKEESPEGSQPEIEYLDSFPESEFLEPDVVLHKRNRPQTEDYNDSEEDILSNLYSKPTERTHAENMSDSSVEFDFPELNAKRYKRDRAKAVGEEMLALQRETLKVLQTISENLSSFHDKFLRALKPRREKRPRLS
ncbi:uncharacterized protein LOC108034494 isoform X2 [Drosophila biarmipes]|uniref:uncharacterized protein LOC108034494 isoform X2 n=1 Tax=Drosophila biarmipes TaxID=125945 RepID=UPI001CDAC3BF|nr:uncharacterized protein LOC108034494 isoform X2 [Drosophila biarmipes]